MAFGFPGLNTLKLAASQVVQSNQRGRYMRFSASCGVCPILAATHLSVHSADDAGLDAVNRLGQSIYIGPTTGSDWVVAVTDRGDFAVSREFLLGRECPGWNLKATPFQSIFTCSQSGQSPLAGATYRFKVSNVKDECGERSRVFVCTSGCKPKRVPMRLKLNHYEC